MKKLIRINKAGKHKKRTMETNMKNLQNCIDNAIANNANACKIICAINSRFAKLGLSMLVVSDTTKMMNENSGNNALGIDRETLTLLDTFSMSEAIQLSELAAKIWKRGKNPYPPINVILNGNTHKGVLWVKMMDELMGLKLKSISYRNLYRGKHYEGKGLFIIVSELPVAELKRGFPKLYSDVILLEKNPSGV